MSSHSLRLVYDGLEATQHKMPTSHEKQIIAGAQEFLGSHAYFFTEGRIPFSVLDRSRHFRIHDIQQRDACWEALFGIDIRVVATEAVQEYVRTLSKGIAREAAELTRIAFCILIYESYKAWKSRRLLSNTVFDRIEPVFSSSNGNGSPIFDTAAEADGPRRALFDRVESSMVKITAPIGRSALHVDIWLDDEKLDRVAQRHFVSDEEFEAALIPIREKYYGARHSQKPSNN